MPMAASVALGVALLLIIASLLVLQRGSILTLPGRAVAYRIGIWLLAAILVLRTVGDFRYVGMFKRERRTRFAVRDTRIYTPLCGLLAAGVLFLAAT
jgi:tetrahydromethanopterin S-methyltransferase subunit F